MFNLLRINHIADRAISIRKFRSFIIRTLHSHRRNSSILKQKDSMPKIQIAEMLFNCISLVLFYFPHNYSGRQSLQHYLLYLTSACIRPAKHVSLPMYPSIMEHPQAPPLLSLNAHIGVLAERHTQNDKIQ